MSWVGNSDECPGCGGTGWLPGYGCSSPYKVLKGEPRPVCVICRGWGRICDIYHPCEGGGMQCGNPLPDDCCFNTTHDALREKMRLRAEEEGRRVFGDFYVEVPKEAEVVE